MSAMGVSFVRSDALSVSLGFTSSAGRLGCIDSVPDGWILVPPGTGEDGQVEVEAVTQAVGRPVHRPVMLQGWFDLTSVHWRYEPSVVQALLPKGFTVDTYGDSAWVGLIPFHMRRIRLPFGLRDGFAAGRWSSFPETNVRTYIVDSRGRRGVWFCSLDITRLAPTLVARVAYGLPYCWSSMSIDHPTPDVVAYTSRRRWPRGARGATADVTVRIGERLDNVTDGSLEAFLSGRWALGSTFLGRRLWAEVDHPPWPLHRAELLHLEQSVFAAAGLPAPIGEPVVLWSPGVDVRIGRPRFD